MVWYVSRQRYFPDGELMVEIAKGGADYSNPDMLSPKYPGEGEEYADPREAVRAALTIRDLWVRDSPSTPVAVGEGYTLGYTMPFEGSEDDALKAWAEKEYAEMEKCDGCGEPLPEKRKRYQANDWDGLEYCSESCATRAAEFDEREQYKADMSDAAVEIVESYVDGDDLEEVVREYAERRQLDYHDLLDEVDLVREERES